MAQNFTDYIAKEARRIACRWLRVIENPIPEAQRGTGTDQAKYWCALELNRGEPFLQDALGSESRGEADETCNLMRLLLSKAIEKELRRVWAKRPGGH